MEERPMNDYTALATIAPPRRADVVAETVARAPSLPALVERVRALAPGAAVRVYAGQATVRYGGRPVVGLAREPGRRIYLCGPA
jgi:hypothetical protein